MNRIIPSVRQLCYAAIGSIAAHPLIKNPPIYYPVIKNKTPEQVRITKWRTFPGLELLNVGDLVCSVYPSYVNHDPKTGNAVTGNDKQKSISYEEHNLGRSSDSIDALDKVTINLIVELHYADVAITKDPIIVDYIDAVPAITDIFNNIDPSFYGVFNLTKSSGAIDMIENTDRESLIEEYKNLSSKDNSIKLQRGQVKVNINPAEEILRDYMELLRIVLNQQRLLPFAVKSGYVKNINFSSANWLQDSANIFFHSAYLVWELNLFLPTTSYLFSSPSPVSSINTSTEIIS